MDQGKEGHTWCLPHLPLVLTLYEDKDLAEFNPYSSIQPGHTHGLNQCEQSANASAPSYSSLPKFQRMGVKAKWSVLTESSHYSDAPMQKWPKCCCVNNKRVPKRWTVLGIKSLLLKLRLISFTWKKKSI